MSDNPNFTVVSLRYKVDQASVKAAVEALRTADDRFKELTKSVFGLNEALNDPKIAEYAKATKQYLEQVNQAQRQLIQDELSARKAAAAERDAIEKDADLAERDAIRETLAARKDAIKQQLADEKAAAAEQEAAAQEAAAAAQRRVRDVMTEIDAEQRFIDKIKEAKAAQSEFNNLEPSFSEADNETASTGGGNVSGRGFGALGRLSMRLGAPTALSQGLFITGETLAGGRGLSNLPLIGGIAAQGQGLAQSAGNAIAGSPIGEALGIAAGTALPAFASAIAGVVAVAAPAAVAIGVIAAGVQHYTDVISVSDQELSRSTKQLDDYYQLIATGTEESIQAQLKVDKTKQDLVDKQLKQEQDAQNNAFVSAQHGFGGDFVARFEFLIGGLSGGMKGLNEDTDKLKQASIDASAAVGADTEALNGGINSQRLYAEGQTRLNAIYEQAAQAVEKELKAKEAAVNAGLGVLETQAQQAANLTAIQQMSDPGQLQAALLANDTERTQTQTLLDQVRAYQKLAGTTQETTDEIAKLQQHTQDLDADHAALAAQYQFVSQWTDQISRSQEVYANSLAETKSALDKFSIGAKELESEFIAKNEYDAQTASITAQRTAQATADEAAYQQQRFQQQADFTKRAAREDTDYYAARAKKIADASAKAQQEDDKVAQQRSKTQRKYNDESLQAAQDLASKVDDIESKTHETELDAASRLDARAVADAARRGADQIKAANKSYDEQTAKRKKALDQELEDQNKAAADAKTQRDQSNAQQLQDEDAQYALRRQREQEDFKVQTDQESAAYIKRIEDRNAQYAAEDTARQAAYNKQITDLRTQAAKMEGIQTDSYVKQLLAAKAFADRLVFEAALYYRQLTDSFTPGQRVVHAGGYQTPGDSPRTQMAAGGIPPLGVPVLVGEYGPETAIFTSPVRIYPHTGSQSAGRSFTVNGPLIGQINGTNLTSDQLQGVVHDALIQVIHKEVAQG